MSIKSKLKMNIVLTVILLAMTLSMLNPAFLAFADFDEANQKFNSESSEFLKDAEEAKDIIEILEKDAEENPNPDRNSINYVMKRLLYPGVYVNNVEDGVLSSSINKKKKDLLHDEKHACNPKAPNNLINHNCNIPNFTTGLIQNIAEPYVTPFSNAEKTSAYSVFGLGVPKNIPGEIVPINPGERKHSYTALELYGYDLKLTTYNGEWDQVVVSNSSRMLSNFGIIDKITLTGTALWNSAREGVASFVENFSFNPVRWYATAAKAFETAASSGINTVVDTSELNIIATNEWKRPNLDRTLYNIYVLSDKEILHETTKNYFTIFKEEFESSANESTELESVIGRDPAKALSNISFNYNPTMETEESKKARKSAKEKRAKEEEQNKNERYMAKIKWEHEKIKYEPKIIDPLTKVPEPIYYTESEQLGFWEDDPAVKAALDDARSEGLLTQENASGYENYSDLKADWEEAYTPYFEEKFNAMGETVSEILSENDSEVFQKYPHLDPKQGISRYACAKADGSVMRDADGAVEYLYKSNNDGETQEVNPKCAEARSPIGGGLLGSGWGNPSIDDTRHISNVSGDDFMGKMFSDIYSGAVRSMNSFIAKITNVILGLSFTPLLEELGLNTIIAKLIENFRSTVFFPLIGLVAALGAIMLFIDVLRSGSVLRFFSSIAITLIIFVAGAAFLLHPSATLSLIDEFPSKMDNLVADMILNEGDDSSYCSTGADKDGIRSAQCNIWGAMVFEPWVHLQFGTGYDNLYAKGHAPAGGSALENKNEDLVGNAAVDMGNGKIVNNWAMYQLSKTKAGTINAYDRRENLGIIDKDMYRIVDLQAGPNKGALSDSRYFDSWSGNDNGGFILLLTFVQALLMAFAITMLGIAKIEVSFMFSLSMLFLPFMLLYAMLPKGRAKLGGYVSGLISLLVKRAILVVMLSVLLKTITLGYSKADSLTTGAFIGIFVSVAFIIYRKELLELISASERSNGLIMGSASQMKSAAGNVIPEGIKQSYEITKAKVRGTSAGFIGGALGAAEVKAGLRFRKAGIALSLAKLEADMARGKMSEKKAAKLGELTQSLEETNKDLIGMKGMSQKKSERTYNKVMNELEKANEYEEQIKALHEKADTEGTNLDFKEVMKLRNKAKKAEAKVKKGQMMIEAGARSSGSSLTQAFKGAKHSGGLIGRTAERRIRAQGLAPLTAFRDIRDTVHYEGAQKITSMEDEVAHDVYMEALSHSKNNKSKSSSAGINSKEDGQLRSSPEIQKKIRKLANERRKMSQQSEYSAITPDMDEMETLAAIIDKKRTAEKVKLTAVNPIAGVNAVIDDIKERKRASSESSSFEDVAEKIDKLIKKGVAPDEIIEILNKDGEVVDTERIYYEREIAERKERNENSVKNQYNEVEKKKIELKEQREKEKLERIKRETEEDK